MLRPEGRSPSKPEVDLSGVIAYIEARDFCCNLGQSL